MNAPALIVGISLVMIAAHAFAVFGPAGFHRFLFLEGAVFPARFWAPDGSAVAYGGPVHAAGTLFSHALLHGGWMHVLLNSAMLLGVGAPVAQHLGRGWQGTGRFLFVFLGSIAAGGAAHLLFNWPDGPPAVGASGGVSGLIAAAVLIAGDDKLLSQRFLATTVAFVAVNLVLGLIGQDLLGAGVAWQAHLGGYAAGALLFVGLRRAR